MVKRAKAGVYLLKKSFFARFLAHNTENKQKSRVSIHGKDVHQHHTHQDWVVLPQPRNGPQFTSKP